MEKNSKLSNCFSLADGLAQCQLLQHVDALAGQQQTPQTTPLVLIQLFQAVSSK